jgi:ATP-dependent Clp protease adaptor protein ClpS
MNKKELKNNNGVVLSNGNNEMYKVVFRNDNHTTMDFIIFVLQAVFQKSDYDSVDIMFEIHHKSASIVGVYPKDIAVAKRNESIRLAKEFGFPLVVSLEKN